MEGAMGRLEGKVAIITGGGAGVGRGIALAMAKEGACVVIAEINPETSARTANEIKGLGARALAVPCDVSSPEDVKATVAAAVKEFGTIDILVNNAIDFGAGRQGTTERPGPRQLQDVTDEEMALMYNSGTMGTFHFMQACFPYLKQRGGKVVNLASGAAIEGRPGLTAYSAAKEAIRAMTGVAAREWGPYNIAVNTVCPLAASSNLERLAKLDPERIQAELALTPMGRFGDCEKDIGRAVVCLVSSDMDYVTGNTISMTGGRGVML